MKTAFLIASLFLLFIVESFAQKPIERNIQIKNFGGDSLHIPLNEDYHIIEDSCAQIIRKVRYSRERQAFYGDFVDLNTTNESMILSKGSYSSEGLKTGLFSLYYGNGKLRAQGEFVDNEFDGTWNLFYETGDPKLTFIAKDGEVTIQEAWDEKGNKVVSEGNGNYVAKLSFIHWSGQLLNGKPEGTWTAKGPHDRTKKGLLNEKFKNGQLKRGTGPLGPYHDESRIIWINPADFPFLEAEQMLISHDLCGNNTQYKLISGVQYHNGMDAYSEEIKKNLSAYLDGVDLKSYDSELDIVGEVSENGRLINLKYNIAFNERIASGIIRALGRLPSLKPALLEGKPIRQKFEINLKFRSGLYYFTYRFLPVDIKTI